MSIFRLSGRLSEGPEVDFSVILLGLRTGQVLTWTADLLFIGLHLQVLTALNLIQVLVDDKIPRLDTTLIDLQSFHEWNEIGVPQLYVVQVTFFGRQLPLL